MSLAQQKAFIKRLDKNLKNVAAYRRHTGQKVSHVFVASRIAVRRGIIDFLRKKLDGSEDTNKVISATLSAVDPLIAEFIDIVHRNVKSAIEGQSVVQGKIVKYQTGARVVAYFAATQYEENKFRNIYQQIYRLYEKDIKELAVEVTSTATQISGKLISGAAKAIWNLEHGNLEGIAESQVKDGIVDALLEPDVDEAIGEKEVLEWLENSNVDLRIVRDTKTSQMFVFIGSKEGNFLEALNSRRRKKVLTDLVKAAKVQLEQEGERIIGLPGSPSFLDLKRKEATKTVVEKIKKKNPKAKIKYAENVNEKGSRTDVSSDNKKKPLKKTSKGLKRGAGTVSAPTRRVKKGVSSSPLTLIKMINAKLPKTVAANMGAPALENRTGRFASSARVVEATKTAKGFTSFGYTYQRDPYGVFESTSGTRFASAERDPRVLIEGSIREIAQELAIGRFFTRRV